MRSTLQKFMTVAPTSNGQHGPQKTIKMQDIQEFSESDSLGNN